MPKKGLSRDRIVDAAAALVEQKGLENITLHELAGALGVKTASLYNHLQGLPELNARLSERALERLMGSLESAMEGKTGTDALRALAACYRTFARDQPQLYKAMLGLPGFADNRLDELKNSYMQLFRRVLAPYGLTEQKQVHFSRLMRSVLHGFVSLEAAGFFRRSVEAEESYGFAVAQLCTQIENAAKEAAEHGAK